MKKVLRDEKPLQVIERSLPLVLGLLGLSLALGGLVIYLFQGMKPLGFLLMVPAAILFFQTLWLILNPFALVYEGHLEIRQSWFHHKDLAFLDLDKITPGNGSQMYLTYTDGEVVKLNLFGIRSSQLQLLNKKCADQIVVNAAKRL